MRSPQQGHRRRRVPTNIHVARTLEHAADLLERAGTDRFRTRAWRHAARTVETLRAPIAVIALERRDELLLLPAIGERMAAAIEEIVRTGTLSHLAELRRRAPPAWFDLARVKGLGPQRARRIAEELGIGSLAELEEAARSGRLREVRGIGPQLERAVVAEIERTGTDPRPVNRVIAERAARPLLLALREMPGVLRAEIAGALRRRAATVESICLVCAAREPEDAVQRFTELMEVAHVEERTERRASVRLATGLAAELVAAEPRDFGAALFSATGTEEHLRQALGRLAPLDLVLTEAGLRRGGVRVPTPREKHVFEALGLPVIPPELREGRGELDAAHADTLPTLVELDDVRADLQVHSTDTDGRESLGTMALAARDRGLDYMAITDHTRTLRIANGMDRDGFLRQMRQIAELNARLEPFTVLAGAEVDILRDGSLDMDDDVLAALDIVLVAIHSHFDLPREEQTKRFLRAVSHPSADVLAHPFGRRIGRRPGADLDLERIARACARRGVLMEANATPERQDLDGEGVRVALAAGALLVVSTDAHSPRELGYLRYGVDQARRGWAEKRHVANALPLAEFKKLLHGTRGKRNRPAGSPRGGREAREGSETS